MKLLGIRGRHETAYLNPDNIASIHPFDPRTKVQGFKVIFVDGASQSYRGPEAAAALDALLASSEIIGAPGPVPPGPAPAAPELAVAG